MKPTDSTNESFLRIARQTTAIYWQYVTKYRLQFVLALIMLPFAVTFMSILSPLIISGLIDRITSDTFDPTLRSVWGEFWPFILAYLIALAAGNVVWRVNGFIFADYQTKAIRDLEDRVFNWLSGHSYAFYSNAFSGALVAQHKRFISAFERIMDMVYWDIYRTAVTLVFSVGVILYFVPLIGVIMLVWSLLFLALSIWLNVKKSKYSRVFAASDSSVTARIADMITNILTVKVFSAGRKEAAVFQEKIEDKRLKFRKVIWFNEWIFVVQGALIVVSYGFVWILSLNLHFDGQFSLGTLLLIWLYWSQLLRDLFFVGRFVGRIEYALSDAAEMTQILNTPHQVSDPKSPQEYQIQNGAIQMQNVSFAYEDGKPLFKNFNLHIPAGQKVGLVGPSGGGKTSITKLLLRFADIQDGTITIDGQDISAITQDDARSAISYVPQEPLLFHRSISENIGYSQKKRNMKQITRAAKLARADIFIDTLADGYNTLVGERGVKLSGGEKQRVAIARALLKDSPILLLDEATSALDSESEQLIQEALEDLMKDKTAIVIAHRLSTIQKLDRIIVMKDGRIAEDGSHAELIKKKGVYADLWNHQTGGFLE